jgi:4'-phosphopantetheinyl transferase
VTLNGIAPGEIQIWHASLTQDAAQVQEFSALLSAAELQRAARFIAAEHQRRFTVARGVLRTLLGRYLTCDPREIQFMYTEHGKPFLADTDLRFNISHSDEIAVYAFTRTADIGVDIEKVEAIFKADVAKRFFSNDEYEILTALFGEAQQRGFYRIWARKEALIKGIGEGLKIPLDSFSVTLEDMQQLTFGKAGQWFLQSFSVNKEYEAAFAIAQAPLNVSILAV